MKRIIICADGTWNDPDQVDKQTNRRRPTNVTKVARAVLPKDLNNDIEQVVYYHDGVGTSGNLDKFTGGAFGRGIEQNIREIYRFIIYNYAPGDELYFFGFSRGAFTVRSLAGFMNKVGLLEKDDDYYVPDIYACYENNYQPNSPEWKKAFHNIKGIRPCPSIRLIGVWDTVGALGAPGFLGQIFNKKKYQYHDVGLNSNIENACHALAIDEQRKPFAPDIWVRPNNWEGQLQQAWFAGVHSNIGGGYTPDGLANEALHWIVEGAEALGLKFDNSYLHHFTPCFNSTLQDSLSPMYRVMGPYIRPIGNHLSDGEVIHQSAIDRMNLITCNYAPANLLTFIDKSKVANYANTTRISRGTPCV